MIYHWIFALMTSWHLCNADNLALLSGTLRTFQQAGCDDDMVTLKCPPDTRITVDLAQYGKYALSESLCPTNAPEATKIGDEVTCLWPTTMQTVVEACQKKSSCQFRASPATFGGDPCPGERKYVEVAYKCRPSEFRSRVACENDRIQLQCNPTYRVAIFSASYGRTEYESSQCPQPQGVAEETCLVSYATETVMQICHGKRRCEISADASTFGNPCRPHTRMYLRIVYTCVPRRVLNKQYEGQLEEYEVDINLDTTQNQDDFGSSNANNGRTAAPTIPYVERGRADDRESAFNLSKDPGVFESPTRARQTPRNQTVSVRKVELRSFDSSRVAVHSVTESTIPVTSGERNQVLGLISAWIHTYTHVARNHERIYLSVLASVVAAIALCTAIFTGRFLVRRRRRVARTLQARAVDAGGGGGGGGSVAHGFVDDISEVDADIDLATPPHDAEVHAHYGGTRLASFGPGYAAPGAAASVYFYG